MNFDLNLKARLVYDGGDKVYIPEELGTPREDQMQGTVHEQLSELCGRTCYDSLGSGRNSADYHKHLIEVNHGSVYEHAHFTVRLFCQDREAMSERLLAFSNRPGLYVRLCQGGGEEFLRVTLNYRHLLDWGKFTEYPPALDHPAVGDHEFDSLLPVAKHLAPQLVGHLEWRLPECVRNVLPMHYIQGLMAFEPRYEREKWITLFLSGSRGWSHEQVRHRFCISQRSTRYVDESKSAWVEHPLISQYFNDPNVHEEEKYHLDEARSGAEAHGKAAYNFTVDTLQPYLVSKGVDKFTARKQARGAARGYLGNALLTEMMFSGSVADWKGILRQRLNGAADAEIRVLYSIALPELKRSRYGDCFAEFETMDAKDGIGTVLKG